jgi:hypothetical protein
MLRLLVLLPLFAGVASGQQVFYSVSGTDIDVDVYGSGYGLDGSSATLRLYDAGLTLVMEVGGPGFEQGRFDRPSAVWARNGLDIFVADYGNHRIQRFDRQLAFVSSLSTRDSENPDQRFGYPTDAVLSRLGDLYVCDGENQRVVRINRLSQVEQVFGGFDAGRGKLERPTRIAIGPKDDLYVLDGSRILVFDAFGNFLTSLYEHMWKAPTALYADAERVIVADSARLFWFGPEHQLLGQLQLSGPIRSIGDVRGIAHHKRQLFLLGENGLAVLADPFTREDND